MTSATEAASAKPQLAAGLAAGVNTLSQNDAVCFTQYALNVLPLDGFVFWLKVGSPPLNIQGSLHYSTQQDQNEDETVGVSTVIFSALQPVQEFNNCQPNTMWIGRYAGDRVGYDGPITFAFSRRGRYYKMADLYHYSGTAVLPVFETQIVNSANDLLSQDLIVSNSLPAWLALNSYTPPYPGFTTGVTLYPSFAVPDNLQPPYGSVHVAPETTEGLVSAPHYDRTLSQRQLSRETVRVTLYGLDNLAAETFQSAVLQYSYDYGIIGMVNMPVLRDEKRTQKELTVLAMKKTIEFQVNYHQATMRDAARQLITKTIQNYLPQPIGGPDFNSDFGPDFQTY